MSIFSAIFLLFLLITGVIYFLCPGRYQWIVLLAASYFFYCWGGGYRTVIFMLISTAVTFAGGILLENIQLGFEAKKSQEGADQKKLKADTTKKKKRLLAAVLIINFGLLIRVKYGSFLVSIVTDAFNITDLGIRDILLPLGISFYTFQSSGYLIDVYRRRIKADRNIAKYALFVSFFPQIIQGPISRYDELAGELYAPHTFDSDRVVRGTQRAVWGYLKKMVIADRIAIPVATIFNDYLSSGYTGFTVFFGALMYGIQIYADFSGGIDIIIGISEALGIKVTENFRQPFMARSVAEFWQRWHITLGAWMRNYIFYPLALSKPFTKMGRAFRKRFGNETGKMIPSCIASFIVFVIVGIWHGADWKFVLYGVFQAVFVSSATLLESFYARVNEKLHINDESRWWNLLRMVRTVTILTFGRYLARADSLPQAISMWRATFSGFNPQVLINGSFLELGLSPKNYYFMWMMIVVMLIVDILHERGFHIREWISSKNIAIRWGIYLAALFLIIIFGMYGPGYNANLFIYQGY